ncbi:MAG TPA: phosphoenolpyruvate carboxykinase (ATP) [Chthonomonadaceae bacterium]|nr:phosphoenolpyruvate carboxykinase (ATP) [Chthonomonadaceae bacterium]
MTHIGSRIHPEGLETCGLGEAARVYWNLPPAVLIEHALCRREGLVAANGALAVQTGKFTGRSPKDKTIVQEPASQSDIWWGAVNQPLSEASFERLHGHIVRYLRGRDLYVQDLYGGAEARYRLPVRVVTERAWHSLFARQLLVRPELFASHGDTLPASPFQDAGFTLLVAPGCQAVPEVDGTRSETFIVLHLGRRLVLIGGTEYAGEIKKSVFTLLNYLLPQQGVLPMHCSANLGPSQDDTALFFGLSGTGKTTLSADPARDLIGDDEHGWADEGVFNFEGGCYAKCIRLNAEAEPEIWNALRFGSVLENVWIEPETRTLDFDSDALTENTRAAYPIDHIANARVPGLGGHPKNVVFLTADAFGVLPPISRLTPAQARFHFLSGYTAKVAGTERGLGSEPEATFSACFGQPFLPLSPTVYSRLLGEKLARHGATVWLINTGWTGGPYGVGKRMPLPYTRAMIAAALAGRLDHIAFRPEPIFGLHVPKSVPNVPCEILNPRAAWADRTAYDRQARHLAQLFAANFEQYRGEAAPDVLAAAPKP